MSLTISKPQPIHGASAWRANSFKSMEDFTLQLPPEALQELEAASASEKFQTSSLEDLRAEDFPLQSLKKTMETIQDTLRNGRGFVVVSGIATDKYSVPQLEKFYWLIGSCLGIPVSQSAAGDFLGHVQDETKPGEKQAARSYKSRKALNMHTDAGDMMGLMCIRQAKSGGESVITSVHAIYNDVLEKASHVLSTLQRGFKYHRRGEQKDGSPIITPYYIPALGALDGTILSHYVRTTVELAGRDGEPLTDLEREALDTFDSFAGSPDNVLEFKLSPGQIFFANNYTTLHARSEFEDYDDPARKRLLLRLWLDARPEWNVPKELLVYENDEGRGGIDPKVGGKRAADEYILELAPDRKMPARSV